MYNITTQSSLPMTIYGLTLNPLTSSVLKFKIMSKNINNNDSGYYEALIKVKQDVSISSQIQISALVGYNKILDASLSATDILTSCIENTLLLQVKGLDNTILNWTCNVESLASIS